MRLDTEIAMDDLVNVRDLHDELRLFDLVAPNDFAELAQAPISLVTCTPDLFEQLGARTCRLQLFAVRRVHRLLVHANLVTGAFHERAESPEGLKVKLEELSLRGRRLSLARAAFEATLDLCLSLFDESTPLADLGFTS